MSFDMLFRNDRNRNKVFYNWFAACYHVGAAKADSERPR